MWKKILTPVVILLVGAALAATAWTLRPRAEREPREALPPQVRVIEAQPRTENLVVRSRGTVEAKTEAQLVSEIGGAITWVSPDFEDGGFFRRGDVLLRIDPRDYELAVTSAKAQEAQARVSLAREEAEAEVARAEWEAIGEGEASPLVLRQPQLEEARAKVAAAEAQVARAELDLTRTRVRAPFAGRLRDQRVDLGEFVNRGTPLATIYSIDVAEIRLPIPDNQLAYLDLDLGSANASGPSVELTSDFAGRHHQWTGRVVRTGGSIDPNTRMVELIVEVPKPFATGTERPPLAPGMFVEATISGREASGVYRVPRYALSGDDRVIVVDDDNQLSFRTVDILRSSGDDLLLERGLSPGDRVLLTALDNPLEGMVVEPRIEGETRRPSQGESPTEIDVTIDGAVSEASS